jgi:hypothetical protein
MEPLHTPQEIVTLSNAAHVAEGAVIILIAAVIVAQGFGYLQKTWQRYLVPSVGLFASLVLVGFLFFDHANELPRAWEWITNDMQQQQHLFMGILIGVGSIAALIGLKWQQQWLRLALPLAITVIGMLFLIHPQHGDSEEAARGLLIHRIAGTSLIIAGLAHAGSLLLKQWRKWLSAVVGIGLILSAVLFISYREPLMSTEDMNHGQEDVTQSHRVYSLNLASGADYAVNQPSKLQFDIRDENNKPLKDFDVVHEKQMHLIVVRKDRTSFQHVHPVFEGSSGTFKLDNFTFPADGEYRIFADFTPSDAQKDEMGMKLPATPYKDVRAGDISKYTPQVLDADRMANNADGFTTEITFPHGDGPSTDFLAKNENTFAVSIKKDGQPYKSLEKHLGALGHMVVLGPNLEFVHAHPLTGDMAQQTGLVYFKVDFPEAGRYKLYLQTQAVGKVSTFDYAVTAKAMPGTTMPSESPDMNMDHSGH